MEESILHKLKVALDTLGPVQPESWILLNEIFKEEEISKGSYFSIAGSEEQKVALVLEGLFRQYHLSDDGEEYNLSFFTADDFLCSGMGHEEVCTSNIQALVHSRILTASYRDFTRLARERPDLEEIHRNFLFQLVQKQQQKDIIQLKTTGRERYQWFLEHHKALLDIIPHYHIASYLGMTPTQLSRIRKIHQQM